MSHETEGLWREFEIETIEHLEDVERRLIDSQGGDWDSRAVGALFRAFHSLKGSFSVMGMTNLEAAAHRAEDILSLVREGLVQMTEPLVDLLLQTVDGLKGMRDFAISHRGDAPPATRLIAELDQFRDSLANSLSVASGEAKAGADTQIDSDQEMLLIFAELLDLRLPEVTGILSSDPRQRASAAEAAAELMTGSEVLGLEALTQTLARIEPLIGSGTDRALVAAALNELHEQSALVEEITGAQAGAAALKSALAVELGPEYRAAIADLSQLLDEGGTGAAIPIEAVQSARGIANCLHDDNASGLLLLLEEQLRRIEAGELSNSPDLTECAHSILYLLTEAAAAGRAIEPDESQRLTGIWQNAIHSVSAGAPAAMEHLPFELRPEFRATMTGEQIGRVTQAVAGGRRAFEILVDVESDPEISDHIMDWLSSAVETVTSRTLFQNGSGCFEFLVLSERPIDQLKADTAKLDPDHACVLEIRDLLGSETPSQDAPAIAIPSAPAFIRVSSSVVDDLMVEVGEMRTLLAATFEVFRVGSGSKAVQALRPALNQLHPQLAATGHDHLDSIEGDLSKLAALQAKLETVHRRMWDAGLKLRVVPVNTLFTRVSRVVRDLATRLGKQVEVAIEGADVRIDKSIVDLLGDSLLHMVRNALDHGIETPAMRSAAGKSPRARLSLQATERGNRVHVAIADDGRGLDKSRILAKAIELGIVFPEQAASLTDDEIFRLILRPGFSTAEAVTELSGRGVGMDVVAATLLKIGGTIEVETASGQGTRFILAIPLSAALVRSLMVEVSGQVFALPERQIVAVSEIEAHEMQQIGDRLFYNHRNRLIPLCALGTLLGFGDRRAEKDYVKLVIISTGTADMAVEVDEILWFQDLFLKELHPVLATIPAIGGASVLGDGRPVLVLDAYGLKSFLDAGMEAAFPRSVAPA